MQLSRITVSGANEFTDIKALLRICEKYPLAEIGIQVSGEKASSVWRAIGGFGLCVSMQRL